MTKQQRVRICWRLLKCRCGFREFTDDREFVFPISSVCSGGGGPFAFKIRNLSHNCSPKNSNMKLLASLEKVQLTSCFSDQLQKHNDISTFVWLYFQQYNKESVFFSQESRMRLWHSPLEDAGCLLFHFIFCTYLVCMVHIHIYMGMY